MKLREDHIRRLDRFLTRIQAETYPEPPTELHSGITRQMFDSLRGEFALSPGAAVLDVGCGQGVALEMFRDAGLSAIGITVNNVDLDDCRGNGLNVRDNDHPFLDSGDQRYDLI